MNKHAYLIMAHNNWNILKLLLKSLDTEYNDFKLLTDSPYLFARKFDENINFEIVQKIYDCVTAECSNE